MVHTFNPSALPAEAGGFLCHEGRPGLHNEFQVSQSYIPISGGEVLHKNRPPQIVEALSSHPGTSPGETGSCLGHAFFPWVPLPEQAR